MLAAEIEEIDLEEKDRVLLLEIAEDLFPGVQDLTELDPPQREMWVMMQHGIVESEGESSEAARLLAEEALAKRETQIASLRQRVAQSGAELRALRQRLVPPPPSPTYDRVFGNQIRWAIHVTRYTLHQRRIKSATPETK